MVTPSIFSCQTVFIVPVLGVALFTGSEVQIANSYIAASLPESFLHPADLAGFTVAASFHRFCAINITRLDAVRNSYPKRKLY